MEQLLPISVKGHVNITDDAGNVLLDRDNAVHPQNLARVIARALSREDNYWIHRIAFGNGGTSTDAAFQITYNTPNDGQSPDSNTWDSRLYNETYSEIINESIGGGLLGTDPGSAGPNAGQRSGGGADPSGDPSSVEHVSGPGVRSNELGLTSEIVISAVLNPGEPTGQFLNDQQAPTENTESDFTFDEIGLYTTGGPAIASTGYQNIDVGNRTSEDDSGLVAFTAYSIDVTIDGGSLQQINFTTPGGGSGPNNEILYGDICEAINTGDVIWGFAAVPAINGGVISITDNTASFPTITGAQTYGFLKVESSTLGGTSTVLVAAGTGGGADMLASINPGGTPSGGTLESAVAGSDAGFQNAPVTATTERERLLTHIIFSPVLKSANRTLTITYTLTVSVARTTA